MAIYIEEAKLARYIINTVVLEEYFNVCFPYICRDVGVVT